MGLVGAGILGQSSGGSGGDIGSYLLGVGILLVVVVLSTFVLLLVRRKMLGSQSQGMAGFSTMEDLREMVDRGEMTKEEYDQVRKTMIDKVRSQIGPLDNRSSSTGTGDST